MTLIQWLAQRAPKEGSFHNPTGWNFLVVWLYSEIGHRAYKAREAKDLARLLCG